MVNQLNKKRKRRTDRAEHPSRRGAALLFSMFVIAFMTLMVVNVLDTTTLEMSALRNGMDYDRALFLANAGIHEATAKIEADNNWTGTISNGSYPADDTYQAVASSGPNYTVLITSSGYAGTVKRTIQATIEL